MTWERSSPARLSNKPRDHPCDTGGSHAAQSHLYWGETAYSEYSGLCTQSEIPFTSLNLVNPLPWVLCYIPSRAFEDPRQDPTYQEHQAFHARSQPITPAEMPESLAGTTKKTDQKPAEPAQFLEVMPPTVWTMWSAPVILGPLPSRLDDNPSCIDFLRAAVAIHAFSWGLIDIIKTVHKLGLSVPNLLLMCMSSAAAMSGFAIFCMGVEPQPWEIILWSMWGWNIGQILFMTKPRMPKMLFVKKCTVPNSTRCPHAGPLITMAMLSATTSLASAKLDRSPGVISKIQVTYGLLLFAYGMIWFIQKTFYLGLSVSKLLLMSGSFAAAALGLAILGLGTEHYVWRIVWCGMWGWMIGQMLFVWVERKAWRQFFGWTHFLWWQM